MTAADLTAREYAHFYANYVSQVPRDLSLDAALADSATKLRNQLAALPPGGEDEAYAPGKWTVREALQHIIDTERIFGYRALRLGRHDPTPLPGFEQNAYAAVAEVSGRSVADMVEEFTALRQLHRRLFAGLTEDDLLFCGTASSHAITCRAMGFIMAGHVYHHHRLYADRYGLQAG